MKMRKAIKKIVALGTGTAMVGATIMGAAAAADLNTYPAPFVDAGAYNAMIVVGAKAAAQDIVGAIDVAMSLQYHMKQSSTVSIDGTASTTVEGGAKIETSAQKVWRTTTLSSVKASFSAEDLDMLADGSITDTAGTDFTYKQYLRNPAVQVAWGEPDSNLDKGILYLDFSSAGKNWTDEIQFPTAVNVTLLANKKWTIFGKEYTFTGVTTDLDTDSFVMFAAGLDQTFTAGDTTTVTVGNEDIDVEVIGVNTDQQTATIKVNGESKSVSTGDNPTVGGVKVYVKDVFAYTAPVTSGAVRLFIGSDKYTFTGGDAVTTGTGSDEIEGTSVRLTTASGGKYSKIEINVDPYSVENGDDTWAYVPAGGEIVDPLFGTFKLAFAGVVPALTSEARDYVKLWPSTDEKLKIKFTNRASVVYDFTIMNISGDANDNVSAMFNVDGQDLVIDPTEAVSDEEYALVELSGYTRVFQVKKITAADNKVKIKDIGTGSTNEYTYTTANPGVATITLSEGDYTATVNETVGWVKFAQASPEIYTKGGMLINVSGAETALSRFNRQFNFVEQTGYNDAAAADENTVGATDLSGANLFNASIGYSNSNTKLTLTKSETLTGSFQTLGDGDVSEFVTPYGTYFKYDSDADVLEAWYHKDITTFDVFFAPVDGKASTIGGGNSVETTSIEKISVGSAKLDTEIADYMAQNLISVGGPCVNLVSRSLMGATEANCADGFQPGVAKIKLFEHANGNVAMMIAGYSAADTKRATRVVSDFDMYSGFEGTEIEVTGTTETDISISAPVATTTTVAATTTTVAGTTE